MLDKITAAIKQTFPLFHGQVGENMRLGQLPGWDSMNGVTLAIELESILGIDLSDVNFVADQTVADVIGILRQHGVQP